MEHQDINTAISIINKDFGLEPDNRVLKSEDELLRWLTQVITYLLEKDFERLLQAMYRIDVDEQKFKSVFAGEGDIADGLAKLVMDREIQKVAFRKKYSEG